MNDSVPYKTAVKLSNEIKRRISFNPPAKLMTVGSILRHNPEVNDIDYLLISNTVPKTYNFKEKGKRDVIDDIVVQFGKEIIRGYLIIRNEGTILKIDFFHTLPEHIPYALYHYTGPKLYNIRSRAQAKRLGYLLNQYGLFDIKTNKPIKDIVKNEKDIFRILGLTYRPPASR